MLHLLRLLAVPLFLTVVPGVAVAIPVQSVDVPFRLSVGASDFEASGVAPEFSRVRAFDFLLDFAGPLEAGRRYTNIELQEARYTVRGRLETNPPTPSGFAAFALIRDESGEGPISVSEWISQSSHLEFAISAGADLADGVQLSELDPIDKRGRILEIDAVELGRLDRARYHPPQLQIFGDGTGLLRNSNNSSKDSGTVNPATGEEVFVDFGEEYVTRLSFDPSLITIIDGPPPVPEPGTALLLGLGLAGLAAGRERATIGRTRQAATTRRSRPEPRALDGSAPPARRSPLDP